MKSISNQAWRYGNYTLHDQQYPNGQVEMTHDEAIGE